MSTDATPAQPTAEDKAQYDSLRRILAETVQKKRAVDKNLAQLEGQIFALETTYLQETAAHSSGNIIQGFDGYLKSQSSGRRKNEVQESDRIFSCSSLTYLKSIELLGEGDDSITPGVDDMKPPNPGITTVIVPPAPTEPLTSAQLKKIRDREYSRRKRAPSRMSTGTVSDEEVVATSSSRRATKRARLATELE